MFNIDSVDQDKTRTGVWQEFAGGQFLIAHTSNPAFQREFNRLQQPHRKQVDKGKLDPQIAKKILCEAMGKYLLLDWKDVGSKSKPIPYSPEAAKEVLLKNEDLRDFVQEISLDIDNYRAEEREREGKPSQTT